MYIYIFVISELNSCKNDYFILLLIGQVDRPAGGFRLDQGVVLPDQVVESLDRVIHERHLPGSSQRL